MVSFHKYKLGHQEVYVDPHLCIQAKRLFRYKMHETVRLSYVPEPESIPQANQYHFGDYKRQEHVLCLEKESIEIVTGVIYSFINMNF